MDESLFEGGTHECARERALARVEAAVGVEDLGLGRVPAVGLVLVAQNVDRERPTEAAYARSRKHLQLRKGIKTSGV